MPLPIDLSGISGLDGIVPVYEPTSRWTHWRRSEIFTGAIGLNRYVPKVDDYVVDTDTHITYRVSAVDPTTALSTLVRVVTTETGEIDEFNVLIGIGPGTQSDTYRVYIDKNVMPYTLTVDARLHVAGSMTSTCRIFKGANLGGAGEVVSAYFDTQGNLLSQNIPLETVAVPNNPGNGLSVVSADGDLYTLQDFTNFSIKTVPSCYTTHNLQNGEIVTAVFYNDAGHVVSQRQLIVNNTAYIRSTELGTKYVTGISLKTPFLSNTNPKLVQYPLNVPLNGLSLLGVVHYSDGHEMELPVDGNRFSVWGFENYVSTITGQEFPLVLKYKLANGEFVAGSTNVGHGEFRTENYRAITLNQDGAFTNKLFCYPVWIDEVSGYRLEWFLYSLERATVSRVTQHVRVNANTPGFNPIAYGVNQQLSVSITLRDVNGTLPAYVHTQVVGITLVATGTTRSTNWKLEYAPNQSPMYGINVRANSAMVNQNLWKLRLDSGFTTQAAWLEALYYRSLPLIDLAKETVPPVPNFFKVVIGNVETEFPIAQWATVHAYTSAIPNASTVFIKFIRRVADNELQLAIAGLPVYQGPDEPDTVVVPPAPLSVSLSTTTLAVNRSSAGTGTGGVLATPAGGTAPYTFVWTKVNGARSSVNSPTVGNPTFSANLVNGDNFQETWTLTVHDAVNASATTNLAITFRVIQPLSVVASPNVSTVPLNAPGVATKQLSATPSNGSAPYTYAWSRTTGTHGTANNITSATPIISANVLEGEDFTETWTVTVTDSLGTTAISNVDIRFLVTQTLVVDITPTTLNIVREGDGIVSGIVNAGITGGYGPFTYQWTRIAGTTTQINDATVSAPIISATVAESTSTTATWRVVVTDATGESNADTVVVTFTATVPSNQLNVTVTPNPVYISTYLAP